MKETNTHIYFLKNWLSQWNRTSFIQDNIMFNCAEQYMMYRKAQFFEDEYTASFILKADDPGEQKRLGRLVKDYNDILWSKVRYNVVVEGNFLKFSQNRDLLEKLQDTGNKILVEANPRDNIWGVALYENDPLILDQKNWRGQNLLGKSLMQVRDILKFL